MGAFLQIALSNAVVAAAAAPLVWLVARVVRRPALTHILWVVVLLKLITPPVWKFPVQLGVEDVPSPAQPAQLSPPRDVDVENPMVANSQVAAANTPETLPPLGATVQPDLPTANRAYTEAPTPVPPVKPGANRWHSWVLSAVEGLWLAGSSLCLVLAVGRMIRFSQTLRYAMPAPSDVQHRADVLACRLGLGAAPGVWLVPGAVCPMLWTVGPSARVLLPRELWRRLDSAQRDAMLLHEIAHYRRKDHWVRWIELAATTLFWWHPACWWARRELREAEEQCCDAWVLWAMPGGFRTYASALIEAVEFISIRADGAPADYAAPPLASGMGQFSHLKRRLVMLKQGNVARALSWGGLAAACGLAAVLLPIAPTVAQSQDPAPKTESVSVAPPQATADPTAPVAANSEPFIQTDGREASNAQYRQTLRKLEAAQRRIDQLTRQLQEAEARIALLGQSGGGSTAYSLIPAPAPQRAPHAPTPYIEPQNNPMSAPALGQPAAPAPNAGATYSPLEVAPDAPNVYYRAANPAPETRSGQALGARPGELSNVPLSNHVHTGRPADQSERLDRIEQQLKSLMDEIHQIRSERGASNDSPRASS